jgi:ABC-2 type transport system ATP-binding protein
MIDYAIETSDLTKRYRGRVAVNGIDIAVPAGVVAGFVGPNGAGKTTTMAMLLGLISPTSGTGRVLGSPMEDPSSYLRRTGALIEQPAFYPGLSGEDNLAVLATIGGYSSAQIPELLELVGLEGRGGDRVRGYSMGMKQRLGIAAALLGDPALLILDEPTNGLDPAGIHDMRRLIGSLAESGRTVFVSSHALAELEQVCDWFAVIDHGTLVFQGPAEKLMDGAETRLIVASEQTADRQRLRSLFLAKGYEVEITDGGLAVIVENREPRIVAADLNRTAIADGLVLVELRVDRMNLEERYLDMMNGGN